MTGRRRWKWLGLLIALAWVALVGRYWLASDAGLATTGGRSSASAAGGALAPTGDKAARVASATPSSAVAASAQTTVAASAAQPASAVLSARARAIRDDWCGFHEAQRSMWLSWLTAQGVKSPWDLPPDVSPGASRDASRTDDPDVEQVRAIERANVFRSWQEALRARADARSKALAEHLTFRLTLGSDLKPEPTAELASSKRLQELARSSTDPMVTALALAHPCPPASCVNVEAAQWSRLEPENARAWIALLREPKLQSSQIDYVSERIASIAGYTKSYQEDAGEMIFKLAQTDTPGLTYEAQTDVLTNMNSPWSFPDYGPVLRACRANSDKPAYAGRCAQIAKVLWSKGDLMDRSIALAFARDVIPKTSPERSRWEARAREYEAVQEYHESGFLRIIEQLFKTLVSTSSYCESLAAMRQQATQLLAVNDWDHGLAAIRESGADLEALSKKWREKNGRSVLDPPKPRPPAASAAKPSPR